MQPELCTESPTVSCPATTVAAALPVFITGRKKPGGQRRRDSRPEVREEQKGRTDDQRVKEVCVNRPPACVTPFVAVFLARVAERSIAAGDKSWHTATCV